MGSMSSRLGATLLAAGVVLAAFVVPGSSAGAVSAGADSFTVTASVRSFADGDDDSCGAQPAQLHPGVRRCLVFDVENHLDRQITVRTLGMSLDPDYPAPPEGCSGDLLELPDFSGALVVPARGEASVGGLPIRLVNARVNQDDCQDTTLHFAFEGVATRAGSDDSDTDDTDDTDGPDGLPGTGLDANLGTAAAAGLVLVGSGLLLIAATRRRRGEEHA